MTKIAVDKALIEQVIDAAFSPYCTQDLAILVPALRAALAEPAVEPVAWYDGNKFYATESAAYMACADIKNLRPVRAPPPPAEVPLLTTDEYTTLAHRIASKYAHRSDPQHIAYTFLPHTLEQFARAIEQAVRQKAGLQ